MSHTLKLYKADEYESDKRLITVQYILRTNSHKKNSLITLHARRPHRSHTHIRKSFTQSWRFYNFHIPYTKVSVYRARACGEKRVLSICTRYTYILHARFFVHRKPSLNGQSDRRNHKKEQQHATPAVYISPQHISSTHASVWKSYWTTPNIYILNWSLLLFNTLSLVSAARGIQPRTITLALRFVYTGVYVLCV